MSIVDQMASNIIYKENQRRSAINTILDCLRVMRVDDRIAEHEYMYALEWLGKHTEH